MGGELRVNFTTPKGMSDVKQRKIAHTRCLTFAGLRARIGAIQDAQGSVPAINFQFFSGKKLCEDDFLVASERSTKGAQITCEIGAGRWYTLSCDDFSSTVFFSDSLSIQDLRSFLCAQYLFPDDGLDVARNGKRLERARRLSELRDTTIDFSVRNYVLVRVNVDSHDQVVFLHAGSLVAHLKALVQAKFSASSLCDLVPRIGPKTLSPTDELLKGPTVTFDRCNPPWSLDTQPLTFEFSHGSRTVRDFSVDASFEFITASLGLSRGVLWDRIIIDREGSELVRNIPDVGATIFHVCGPAVDVSWELRTDPRRKGVEKNLPYFAQVIDVKKRIATATELSFFKIRLLSSGVGLDDAAALSSLGFLEEIDRKSTRLNSSHS
jgi:hypothetical protein